MRKRFVYFSRFEKVLLICLGVLFLSSLIGLFTLFFEEKSVSVPAQGGVYKEGIVGDVANLILNPVFVYGKRDKSPEADISSLIFSGLMKFDSKEGKIKDNLATHSLSADKKTYTFRLHEGLRWHDGASLTIDDVLFTFQDVIKNDDFDNEALKRAFSDVKIEKISDNEIAFTIPYPYKFFLTNFTVGLLPKHILKDIPVSEMEYNDFSQNPVGNGPFKYDGIEEVRRSIFKVRLNAFHKSSQYDPYLEAVEFYFYPSRNALSLDSKNLSGIRPFPEIYKTDFDISDSLQEKSFSLPQYSALFFNMKKDIFADEKGKKLRLALQLATDKESLIQEDKDDENGIVPAVRIDTPLLETNKSDWLYEFDLEKANGSLKDAGYFLPSSKPKTFVPKESDEKLITFPTEENVWEGERSEFQENFIIKGKYPLKVGSVKISVDGKVKKEEAKPELARSWEFLLPFDEEFQDETHEIRIEFLGFQKELIAEDAVSIYLSPTKEESEEEGKFEIREDKDGNKLKLTLVTAANPYYYKQVAEYLQNDFGSIGVELEIKVLNMQDFLYSVQHREYDILLYGQNLGYNLDIYEFFHESQVGKDNLSDYQNSIASILIEEIRSSHVQEVRDKKLQELREIFKTDIPAIFLFSPKYRYYYDTDIEGLHIQFIAFHKDRFSQIDTAYLVKEESFAEGSSWTQYPKWFFNNFISFITFSL